MATLEVCVEGFPGALAAQAGGADRVELCAGLVEGGTTPSRGTIEATIEALSIPTVVLIRPRGGDFLYSAEEVQVMLRDVRRAREAGAFGVATGALTESGEIDLPVMESLLEEAGPLSITFHRAFDMLEDPLRGLQRLARLGVDRILTSGQERSVPEGLPLIRRLVEQAGDGISIMPGGGIKVENVRRILEETGAREIHFTATTRFESPALHRNLRPRMGSDRVPGEYDRVGTDPEFVRRIREAAERGHLL